MITLIQPFFEESHTVNPIVAIAGDHGPIQAVVGERDDVVTPQPYYGECYMTYHVGREGLVVLDGDHVFGVFTGDGAPAPDEAIEESVDWFSNALKRRRR